MTDLAKMERLLPLATKAPWREDGYRAYAQKDGEEVVLFEIKYTPAEYEDLELLVALRNGAADLIRDARELAIARAEIERLRGALHSLAAVARRYLPDYDEHPEVQKADEALQEPTP